MSEMNDVDRTITAFLLSAGSDELPATLVDGALDRVARTSQRGRLALAVTGPEAWPAAKPAFGLSLEERTIRLLVAALLALVTVGASILVGSRLLKPPSPWPMTYDGTLTLAGQLPTSFVTPGFGAAQLADGRVVSESGENMAGAENEGLIVWDEAGLGFHELGRTLAYRQQAHLVPLADGRLLLVGGDLARIDDTTAQATASTAEVFDPATGRSAKVIALQAPRWAEGVVALADGRVLAAGGEMFDEQGSASTAAEVLDPATGSSRLVGAMHVARVGPSMALLPDGRVLVVGGDLSPDYKLATAEIFDPATGSFSPAPELEPAARGGVQTVTLPDGRIVVIRAACVEVDMTPHDAAGRSATFAPTPVDIYDPASGKFSRMGELPHCTSTATRLTGGQILVTGYYTVAEPGNDPMEVGHMVNWSGLYDPATGQTRMTASPLGHYIRVVALANGRALLYSTPEQDGLEGAIVQLFK